jgi:hypothetical protein
VNCRWWELPSISGGASDGYAWAGVAASADEGHRRAWDSRHWQPKCGIR